MDGCTEPKDLKVLMMGDNSPLKAPKSREAAVPDTIDSEVGGVLETGVKWKGLRSYVTYFFSEKNDSPMCTRHFCMSMIK